MRVIKTFLVRQIIFLKLKDSFFDPEYSYMIFEDFL